MGRSNDNDSSRQAPLQVSITPNGANAIPFHIVKASLRRVPGSSVRDCSQPNHHASFLNEELFNFRPERDDLVSKLAHVCS